MKKIILNMGALTVIVMIFLPAIITFAADELEYTMLTPLPCVGGDCAQAAQKTTLEKYLPGMFQLAIGLSAVWAVLMIVIGGFQYISTDAVMKKSEGRERIKNAIFGLVLVIGSWIILNTINPNLLKIDLNIESAITSVVSGGKLEPLGGEDSAGTGKTLAGYPLNEDQVKKNTEMQNDLAKYNVSVNNGPCIDGGTKGCTNLVGMPEASYQGVKDLAKNCGCNIVITGGTEGGHASHGPDKPQLDLRFNSDGIDKYIKDPKNQVAPVGTQFGYPAYTVRISNSTNATFVQEGDHWHVKFGR